MSPKVGNRFRERHAQIKDLSARADLKDLDGRKSSVPLWYDNSSVSLGSKRGSCIERRKLIPEKENGAAGRRFHDRHNISVRHSKSTSGYVGPKSENSSGAPEGGAAWEISGPQPCACVRGPSSWQAANGPRHNSAQPSDSWHQGPTSHDTGPASGRNASSGDASEI